MTYRRGWVQQGRGSSCANHRTCRRHRIFGIIQLALLQPKKVCSDSHQTHADPPPLAGELRHDINKFRFRPLENVQHGKYDSEFLRERAQTVASFLGTMLRLNPLAEEHAGGRKGHRADEADAGRGPPGQKFGRVGVKVDAGIVSIEAITSLSQTTMAQLSWLYASPGGEQA